MLKNHIFGITIFGNNYNLKIGLEPLSIIRHDLVIVFNNMISDSKNIPQNISEGTKKLVKNWIEYGLNQQDQWIGYFYLYNN